MEITSGTIILASAFISFVVLAFFIYRVIKKLSDRNYEKYIFSALDDGMIGIFCAVFIVLLSNSLFEYVPANIIDFFKDVALAFHNTIKVFIADSDFKNVILEHAGEILKGKSFNGLYLFYCALLHILAPLSTVSYVLLLFKNVFAKLRFRMPSSYPIYIMSDLNERSIHLAKNIWNKDERKAKIVFCDVYDEDVESNKGLLLEAKRIKAICLNREITNLDVSKKEQKVEFFLIADDETKNVNQALAIIENNKKHFNRKVFVFATNVSSAYIIDSADKGALFDVCDEYFEENKQVQTEKCFKVRRVDESHSFAWDTVSKAKIFDRAVEVNGEKVISVLIVGFGRYGVEFLKATAWMCQMTGYKLEINVIDKIPEKENKRFKMIKNQYSEFYEMNKENIDGDAFYDIEFYFGVDICNESLTELIKDEKTKARLSRTTTAFVLLGDDDINIEAAVELRRAFDRLQGKVNVPVYCEKTLNNSDAEDSPAIFAAVFDEHRYIALKNSSAFKNHANQLYNIKFEGGLSRQYSYDKVYRKELEEKAYEHHVKWVEIEEKTDGFYKDYREDVAELYINLSSDPNFDLSQNLPDEKERVAIYEHIAKYYADNKLYQKAKEIFEKIIEESAKIENSERICFDSFICIANLSDLCIEEQADYCKKAEEVFNKLNENERESSSYSIEYCYMMLKDSSYEHDSYYQNLYKAIHEKNRQKKIQKRIELFKKYEQFEYFRHSSMTKEIHRQIFEDVITKDKNPELIKNRCEIEHMRWTAYMRSEGYIKGNRNDRAKIHNDLRPYQELKGLTKLKDAFSQK